jgi:hypothetical protein
MSARDVMKFAENILDILFPPSCAGCQKSGHILCPSCIMQISPLPAPVCRHCSTPLTTGGTCKQCQYHPPSQYQINLDMGQNLSWSWFNFQAVGPCCRTRQRSPEVIPRPLNRQTRREETSRRPEQGNANDLSVRVKPLRAAFSSRM